jgi:acyl CoA:acetate/3-ketoacid CoA transferase alpha subunit
MIARNLETRTVKTGRGGPQMILERRLSKLEASFLPKNSRPWRRMSGTEAECETAQN